MHTEHKSCRIALGSGFIELDAEGYIKDLKPEQEKVIKTWAELTGFIFVEKKPKKKGPKTKR